MILLSAITTSYKSLTKHVPKIEPVRFGENFIKQKLQGTPNLMGAGHLFGPLIRI